jgi:hypothetical protein
LTVAAADKAEQYPRQEHYPCNKHGDPRLLSEDDEGCGDLAKKCRELAVRCYRLAVAAFDQAASAGFKRWGDELMAQADALDQAKGTPERETDES